MRQIYKKTNNQMEEFKRKCPSCDKEIIYKNKTTFKRASSTNTKCMKCNNSGQNNPFYGKTHNDDIKNIFRENNLKNIDKYRSEEFRNKVSHHNKGNKNPMFGKSFYEVWVEKYGRDIADEKMNEFKIKQSINNTGENNSMFGRPSPNGSGNGWSGWYGKFFFKSLKELSFILMMEKEEIDIESAERKKFRIGYIDRDGNKRNYYPDFFIKEKKLIVECKPSHFFESEQVLLKKESALKFCEENGLTYKLIDPVNLTNQNIKELYDKGLIRFIDRYEKKYNDKFIS